MQSTIVTSNSTYSKLRVVSTVETTFSHKFTNIDGKHFDAKTLTALFSQNVAVPGIYKTKVTDIKKINSGVNVAFVPGIDNNKEVISSYVTCNITPLAFIVNDPLKTFPMWFNKLLSYSYTFIQQIRQISPNSYTISWYTYGEENETLLEDGYITFTDTSHGVVVKYLDITSNSTYPYLQNVPLFITTVSKLGKSYAERTLTFFGEWIQTQTSHDCDKYIQSMTTVLNS